LYGAFLLAPLAHTVWISFYSWDGLSVGHWVGLQNYSDALQSPDVRGAFLHSVVLILFFSILPIVLSLALAGVMTRSPRLKFAGTVRTVLFLPQVIATVVVATLWAELLSPQGGINQLLEDAGLASLTRPWLGSFVTALPAVGLIGTWIEAGLCLLLFMAGAGQIPRELYEAARVDGAGAWREFVAITLPGLRGQVVVALTLTVTAALRTFDIVYIATSGGPGTATQTPAFLIYDRAFITDSVGSACAIGVLLTILIFGLAFLITRLDRPAQL